MHYRYNKFLPTLGKLSPRYEVFQMSARVIKIVPLVLSSTYRVMYGLKIPQEAIVVSGCVSSKFDAILGLSKLSPRTHNSLYAR